MASERAFLVAFARTRNNRKRAHEQQEARKRAHTSPMKPRKETTTTIIVESVV